MFKVLTNRVSVSFVPRTHSTVSMLFALSCVLAAAAGAAPAEGQLAGSLGSPPGNSCPSGWLEFQESCFWASDFAVPWRTAVAACRLASPQSLPASIHSRFENAALESLLSGQKAWVGLRRNSSDIFTWNDGTDTDFTFWDEKEPDDRGDCVFVDSDGVTGQWGSANCEQEHLFTCRQPKNLCPGGWWMFEGVCYQHNTSTVYSSSQVDACKSIHANAEPASIHTLEANYFLASLIRRSSSSSYTWMGLARSSRGGAWHWLDGSDLDFEGWDSVPTYSDQFVTLDYSGEWHTRSDDYHYPFFCQIVL